MNFCGNLLVIIEYILEIRYYCTSIKYIHSMNIHDYEISQQVAVIHQLRQNRYS